MAGAPKPRQQAAAILARHRHGRSHGGVEAQEVDGLVLRHGQVEHGLTARGVLEPAQQDRREVGAAGRLRMQRGRDAEGVAEHDLVQGADQAGSGVVLLELRVVSRRQRVPPVLVLERDQHLVDERLAEALDLLPLAAP